MADWADATAVHTGLLLVALAVSALVITVVGIRAARLAVLIVAATGLGQALVGAVLLGAGTSIPELVVTTRASLAGNFDISIANAVGGVVAQTVMLVVADATMRRRNMEYASRHHTPIVQAALLSAMLGMVVLAGLGPDMALWVVHPASLLLVAGYLVALVLAHRAAEEPVWVRPGSAAAAVEDEADDEPDQPDASAQRIGPLAARFTVTMAVLGVASFVLTDSATELGERTGIAQTVVGGLLIALATSLPELVTAIGAIREQAVTMAIGDVLGGNLFDALFPALTDVLHGRGSVYALVDQRTLFLAALGMVVTCMLVVEVAQPPRRGLLSVGAMSIAIVAVALSGYAVLIAW